MLASHRDETSNHATEAQVDGSDASGDEFWFISPAKKKAGEAAASSFPRDVFQDISSISSGQRSVKKSGHVVKGSFASPLNTQKTPMASSHSHSRNVVLSTGTPSSRSSAIDSAFKKTRTQGSDFITPTKSGTPQGKPRVIVIDDSDDEATDIEVPESPTKIASSGGGQNPISAESSASSLGSLFSSMSMTSSFSSVESIPQESSRKQDTARPVAIEDVFQADASSDVRTRNDHLPSTTPSLVPYATTSEIPEAIWWFANSQFGVDLEPLPIAHDDETQQLMDLSRIEWGTQFELARGVSTGTWTWDEVHKHIPTLGGNNANSAYRVQRVMRGGPSSIQPGDTAIWQELDREQASIQENRFRGLGLMGEWEGHSDWYGGQIQQLARLVKVENTYKIVLEPMENRRSHRFARFYGSRRFLQLRIPDEIRQNENEKMRTFLLKKFVLCGRVFVPFHSKEGALYLVETDENWGRTPQDWCGDQYRIPFHEFINWHNPIEKNFKQVISKYATRFALGLSNSVPALEFDQNNIFFIDDLTSSEWPEGKKDPPANKLMTDGCGFLNHAALLRIVKIFRYESLPSGVQGRIDGSKGFWILDPHDNSDEPKIWIRTSQNKIQNRFFDRAHVIFDLLCPSRHSASTTLSQQSIINLFANEVPQDTLIRLMEEGLEKAIAPLLKWEGRYAMPLLWDAINKCGGISGSRTQRLATALNRVLGLKGRDWGNESVEMDGVKQESEDDLFATYTGRNPYSGAPLALHEYAMELVQANFHPAKMEQLYEKIKFIMKKTIEASVKDFRIPILESLGAFIVPDPLNVLKEGEIYYRFSRPRTNPRTGMLVHTLEGDVVVGRYPIRLPSDMQKVKAVDKRQLSKYPDVVIVSTQGRRSLANMLADGDMDGDELIVIYDPDIVEPFESKPFTNPPDDLMTSFEQKVEKVGDFCARVRNLSPRQASEAFQEVLIGNLNDPPKGLYSMMHENASVMYGYGSSETIRLGYIFTTLLDSSKTGHRLKPGVMKKDLARFGTPKLDSNGPSSTASLNILKILEEAADKKGQQLLERYQAQRPQDLKQCRDVDLCKPYDLATDHAITVYNQLKIKAFTEEMSRIRKHVDEAHKLFQEASFRSQAKQGSPTKRSRGAFKKKSDQEDPMLASARAYAEPIKDILLIRDVEQVKASYAYKLSPSFALSVAFRELCHIKALASSDGIVPLIRIFDEGRTFSASFLRSLSLCDKDLAT